MLALLSICILVVSELTGVSAAIRYSTWLADSVIARGQGHGLTGSTPVLTYDHGVFQRALEMLYSQTGNATYYNYIQSGLDNVVDSGGNFKSGLYSLTYYSLDPIRVGPSFLYVYKTSGSAKYKVAPDLYRSQLNSQPRTSEGAYWHRSTYPNQQWLDGVYMADVFYAQYTNMFASTNTTAWNDILLQYQLVENHLIQSSSGLLFHGYDQSKTAVWANPTTGASPEVWDRALGWYAMALVDALDYIPKSQTAYTKLLGFFTRLAPALKSSADATSGVWWLVMSQPGRSGNYFESSGSSMFVYALLKGIRMGYIDKATYLPTCTKAYTYLTTTFVVKESDGTAGWLGTVSVGSLGSSGTFEYYISVAQAKNDLKGVSPFIMASVEYELAGLA